MKNIFLAIALYLAPFLALAQCSVSLQTTSTINCHGQCTGALSAIIGGGVGPYTYSWSPNTSTDADVSGLCAGTYTVVTSDFFGCTATDTYVFSPPQVISITPTVKDASCAGYCDGDISMSVSGGTLPYTYDWVFGYVTEDLHGICPGTYCETISDSNGCALDTCFIVTEPIAIVISETVTNVSCAGKTDGAIALDVFGGVNPLKYLWLPSGDSLSTIDTLAAGSYCVTVTDVGGCASNECFEVTEPLPFSITAAITEPLCYGGSDGCLMLSVSGGTPQYTYQWNSGATTKDLCPVPSTYYAVHITDLNSCAFDTNFTVAQPDYLDVSLTGYNTSCIGCGDGRIDVNVTGGTPSYNYQWTPSISSGSSATGLAPGTYIVCVTDLNNCTTCDTVAVYEDPTSVKNETDMSLVIYPNPAKNKLWVMSDGLWVNPILEINNILGENLYRLQLITQNSKLITPIDVSSLPKGIYFLKVISSNGDTTAVRKILVE